MRRTINLQELWLGGVVDPPLPIPNAAYLISHLDDIVRANTEAMADHLSPGSQRSFTHCSSSPPYGIDHRTLLLSSYESLSEHIIDLSRLDILAVALLITGALYPLIKGSDIARALLLFASTSVAYIMVTNVKIFPHYYNALLPILIIMTALPLAALLSLGNEGLKSLALGELAALFVGQLNFSGSLLTFQLEQDFICGEYAPLAGLK